MGPSARVYLSQAHFNIAEADLSLIRLPNNIFEPMLRGDMIDGDEAADCFCDYHVPGRRAAAASTRVAAISQTCVAADDAGDDISRGDARASRHVDGGNRPVRSEALDDLLLSPRERHF